MLFSVKPAVCYCLYLNNREPLKRGAQLGAIRPIGLRPALHVRFISTHICLVGVHVNICIYLRIHDFHIR